MKIMFWMRSFSSHLVVVRIHSMIELFSLCIECKRDWEKSKVFFFSFDGVPVIGDSETGCG